MSSRQTLRNSLPICGRGTLWGRPAVSDVRPRLVPEKVPRWTELMSRIRLVFMFNTTSGTDIPLNPLTDGSLSSTNLRIWLELTSDCWFFQRKDCQMWSSAMLVASFRVSLESFVESTSCQIVRTWQTVRCYVLNLQYDNLNIVNVGQPLCWDKFLINETWIFQWKCCRSLNNDSYIGRICLMRCINALCSILWCWLVITRKQY